MPGSFPTLPAALRHLRSDALSVCRCERHRLSGHLLRSVWQSAPAGSNTDAALVFEAQVGDRTLVSDDSWRVQRPAAWSLLAGTHAGEGVPVEIVDAPGSPAPMACMRRHRRFRGFLGSRSRPLRRPHPSGTTPTGRLVGCPGQYHHLGSASQSALASARGCDDRFGSARCPILGITMSRLRCRTSRPSTPRGK
jgi:hypothetical protein